MNRRRDLLVANLAALLLLAVVLLLGWWQEAAFGLAVLLFLDLFVFLRWRQARSEHGVGARSEHGVGARSDAARATEATEDLDQRPEPGEGVEPG